MKRSWYYHLLPDIIVKSIPFTLSSSSNTIIGSKNTSELLVPVHGCLSAYCRAYSLSGRSKRGWSKRALFNSGHRDSLRVSIPFHSSLSSHGRQSLFTRTQLTVHRLIAWGKDPLLFWCPARFVQALLSRLFLRIKWYPKLLRRALSKDIRPAPRIGGLRQFAWYGLQLGARCLWAPPGSRHSAAYA